MSIVQYKETDPNDPGTYGSLAFTSANAAGNTLVCVVMGRNVFATEACSDTNSNSNWADTPRASATSTVKIWICHNCAAGSNTINFAGPLTGKHGIIFELSGIEASSNPLLSNGQATGSTSPLQYALTFANTAFILGVWANDSTDNYTGMNTGQSLFLRENSSGFWYYAATGINSDSSSNSPRSVGVTTGGASDNAFSAIALKLAVVGSPAVAAPGTGQTVTLGYSPSVIVSNNQTATPGLGANITLGYAPSVIIGNNTVARPGVGQSVTLGYSPLIVISDNKTAYSLSGQIITLGYSPVVSVTQNIIASPGAGVNITTGYPARIIGSVPPTAGSVIQAYPNNNNSTVQSLSGNNSSVITRITNNNSSIVQ